MRFPSYIVLVKPASGYVVAEFDGPVVVIDAGSVDAGPVLDCVDAASVEAPVADCGSVDVGTVEAGPVLDFVDTASAEASVGDSEGDQEGDSEGDPEGD